MKKDLAKPTDSELEILQILWKRGSSTVREINEQLKTKKDVGYTTTLKLMQIMFAKKLLSREEKGRTHVYRATIEEKEIQRELVDKLLDSAFGGSAMKLVMQTLNNKSASTEEIKEIRSLLNKLEGDHGISQ